MQGRGGRTDDGRGWEARKQRREARADGSGASAPGSRASAPGSRARTGSAVSAGARRCDGGRESGDLGEKRRDEAGRVRILG